MAPRSEADAAKRIFDAAKPLREHGVAVLDALDTIATAMRERVTTPTVKGDLSTHLHEVLPEGPYQRFCRPCQAVHLYEQPFRLSALRAGLELEPGTSPPVLRRIPGWRGPAKRVDPALDPIRAVLRLLGPASVKHIAEYVDSPVAEVRRQLPGELVRVSVAGEERWLLPEDEAALADPADVSHVVRLLGPFDLFLQARDRALLVPDESRRKQLWPVLGRPGGVLVGHEIVGAWRPRTSGSRLRLEVDAWGPLPDLTEQAERLAAFRGLTFAGFTDAGSG